MNDQWSKRLENARQDLARAQVDHGLRQGQEDRRQAHEDLLAAQQGRRAPVQASGGSIDTDAFAGGIKLAAFLAIAIMPPWLLHKALGLLLSKFPRYAADPSFAGQTAGVFVRLAAPFESKLQALHWHVSTLGSDVPGLFWYVLCVWIPVFLLAGISWKLWRLRPALSVLPVLALAAVIGPFVYVVAHFSR